MTSFSNHYQEDLKVFQEFFDGKSESIKQQILSEIDACIHDQRFEWASTLRDIYLHIDQHTQQQTVLLDSRVHGIVAAIYSLQSLYILIIIVFQKGKIVDIIRFHYYHQECDEDQIIHSLELEYGTMVLRKTKHCVWWHIYHSSSLVGSKRDWWSIETNLLAYKDSFIASISSASHPLVEDLLVGLQKRYHLLYYPYHIECLDISHLSSWWASGWISSMKWLIGDKNAYRRYRIPIELWWDDYGSITYILLKKFSNNSSNNSTKWSSSLPDLFIIDGAYTHLKVLQRLFEEWSLDRSILKKIQFVSLWKGDARKSWKKIQWAREKLFVLQYNALDYNSFNIQEYELMYDTIDKTLLTIRDEAHRFANAYRKKQYSMEYKKIS